MKFLSIEKKSMIGLSIIFLIFITSIIVIGKKNLWFEAKNYYTTNVAEADGLAVGNIVTYTGLRVGEITELNVLEDQNLIQVKFSFSRSLSYKIREDSTARFYRSLLIGDKKLEILPGSKNLAEIPNHGFIKSSESKELLDFLTGGDLSELLVKFDKVSSGLSHLTEELSKFSQNIKSEDLTKTYQMINPTMTNFNKLVVDLNVFIQVLSYMKTDLLQTKLAKNTLSNINEIVSPIAKRDKLLVSILDNLESFSGEIKNNPHMAKDITTALKEVITTLKAIQKTWILKSHVEDIKKEEH